MRIVLIAPAITASRGDAQFHRGLLQELAFAGHQTVALRPLGLPDRPGDLRDRVTLSGDYPGITADEACPVETLDKAVHEADIVLVHDRTPAPLRRRLARMRRSGLPARLFLHDTHARLPEPGELCTPLEADGFDGVLAGCGVLAQAYARRGWGRQATCWTPGVDTRVFTPLTRPCLDAEAVMVAHWGPRRQQADFVRWVVAPLAGSGVRATLAGDGYPLPLQDRLLDIGVQPPRTVMNMALPELFSRHRVALQPPAAPDRVAPPGKPPLPMLEAMACGLPVIRGPWADPDGCFETGEDHLAAASPDMMAAQIQRVLMDTAFADALGRRARQRVAMRHSCIVRAQELLAFAEARAITPHQSLHA